MIYAICTDRNGNRWAILKGWMGCRAGDGRTLREDVPEAKLQDAIAECHEESLRVGNHRWADPEHPADGVDYCSIGREKQYHSRY
jgi:hypothetical protein